MAECKEVLNEELARVAKEQGYEDCVITSKQISSGGANYTSYIYQASITAPNKEELKLFVKVAAVGEKMREFAPFRLFESESFAYNKLLKTYKAIEEKYSVPEQHRLVTPKFYGTSDDYLREAVVLGDLSASGFTTYDRFQSIDWEYASKSVQNLAKLHALSIAWSVEDPEGFENTDTISVLHNSESTLAFFNTVVANALEVTKEENKERLSKFIKHILDDESYMASLYKPIKRPVMAHGDYRPSNLMHKVKEDGTLEVISVDYQTLQRGNPIIDLIYFIFTGSDKSFRDQHYKQTLECYYAELCAALRRFSLDPDEIYPREDFEYELQKILPVGLTTGMFCLPLVTVDEQDAPIVGKETAFTDFNMTPNPLYKKRLNEIIDDFIQMGVI
ncbi:jg9643 [Pararge aegeria aegeria]|uniref:Jg9643 protein n=1 Tax=Pararge aegeria aegeria TaxID=348720 RepID=A0A8S4RTA2_9NEOP|nr:jg9643 [Pararge aegeria aegeria]